MRDILILPRFKVVFLIIVFANCILDKTLRLENTLKRNENEKILNKIVVHIDKDSTCIRTIKLNLFDPDSDKTECYSEKEKPEHLEKITLKLLSETKHFQNFSVSNSNDLKNESDLTLFIKRGHVIYYWHGYKKLLNIIAMMLSYTMFPIIFEEGIEVNLQVIQKDKIIFNRSISEKNNTYFSISMLLFLGFFTTRNVNDRIYIEQTNQLIHDFYTYYQKSNQLKIKKL